MGGFKCTSGFAMAFVIIGVIATVVGCVTDYWKSPSDKIHYGLIRYCVSSTCTNRQKVLDFDENTKKDIVLILLIGCGGLNLITIFLHIGLLCKKNSSLKIAVWIIIINFFSAGCGIGSVVYANLQSSLQFDDKPTKQWSLLVVCIGVLFTCLAFILSFCFCCASDLHDHHTSYIDNLDIHSNFGTATKKSSAPTVEPLPYNPSYHDLPTTPSYNELHQQMPFHQGQYPMGHVSPAYPNHPPGYLSY